MVDRIERELVLDAPPRDVWEVVTGSGWLADEVEFDLTPGGEARFETASEIRTGWVEEAVAPDEAGDGGRLVFWWGCGEEPASRVEVCLRPDGTATHLRVREERPLEVLDVVGIPLPGAGDSSRGPLMASLALA